VWSYACKKLKTARDTLRAWEVRASLAVVGEAGCMADRRPQGAGVAGSPLRPAPFGRPGLGLAQRGGPPVYIRLVGTRRLQNVLWPNPEPAASRRSPTAMRKRSGASNSSCLGTHHFPGAGSEDRSVAEPKVPNPCRHRRCRVEPCHTRHVPTAVRRGAVLLQRGVCVYQEIRNQPPHPEPESNLGMPEG
jgi:hypothetical protein